MARKKIAPTARKEHRQSIVRSLMARGLEQHEIHTTLSQPKYADREILHNGVLVPNPNFVGNVETGEPVDRATINRDWKDIREQWRSTSLGDIDEHFGRQLAEIQEKKREAQALMSRVLDNKEKISLIGEWRGLQQLEVKLLGTARPERKEIKLDDNQFEQMQSAEERVRGKIAQMMSQLMTNQADDDSDSED
jgi:hypothetical protein